ncbi:MAG: tRNA pseudouridine(55) synthase TruB [Pirellulaceae bacterium]|nr:tRNA pseudouridine(55) synthase TruB [Pirellulaceae bacterium]
MLGILNINKPSNVTSRDVVSRVCHVYREATGNKLKAGHAGTLDPGATGVLIVCLGKATRLIRYIQEASKTYQGKFQLGVTSASVDLETDLVHLENPIQPRWQDIELAIPRFCGKILQKPPAYSAISIKGQRAYKLARQGISFDIKAKEVQVHRIDVHGYQYPFLELEIECGSGTYIRSLGRDLARFLQSDAVMTQLCRTAIGQFRVVDAMNMDEVTIETIRAGMISPCRAVEHLPQVIVDRHQVTELQRGGFISLENSDAENVEPDNIQPSNEIMALDHSGKLVAILEPRGSKWKPLINLSAE